MSIKICHVDPAVWEQAYMFLLYAFIVFCYLYLLSKIECGLAVTPFVTVKEYAA